MVEWGSPVLLSLVASSQVLLAEAGGAGTVSTSLSAQGGWRDAEDAHLGQPAQQAEGDSSRSTAHIQDEGATLGFHRMGLLGHLLQHPVNQLLQGR